MGNKCLSKEDQGKIKATYSIRPGKYKQLKIIYLTVRVTSLLFVSVSPIVHQGNIFNTPILFTFYDVFLEEVSKAPQTLMC